MRHASPRGATMVEFSIVLPVLIIIIAFAIDGFVAAFRYSKMTYGVAELTRRVTVAVGIQMDEANSCAQLTNLAATLGGALTSGGGSLKPYFLQQPQYEVVAGTPYPFLTVIGSVDSGCVLCSFIPAGLLETRATLAIERQSTVCR